MLSIGAIIWISVRPLIRLILCASFGFAITKADIFPVLASRAAGQIILQITLPCLMFSKIVPAFSIHNIGSLGPLFLVGFIYEGLGLLLAWTVKKIFWVPHRFRYSLIMAGTWSNWADLPTAVVMSITSGPPFNSATDPTLAVAYVSAFIFIFYFTLFPCCGSRLVSWDFTGPEVEDEEMREAARLRRAAILGTWKRLPTLFTQGRKSAPAVEPPEKTDYRKEEELQTSSCDDLEVGEAVCSPLTSPRSIYEDGTTVVPSEQASSEIETVTRRQTSSPSLSPSLTNADLPQDKQRISALKEERFDAAQTQTHPSFLPSQTAHPKVHRILINIRTFALGLLSPASLSVILAFPIALITPLKGLLVPLPNSPIPNAPDGQPPLAFIMDTASFVGAASVPLGLICLGSALARLKIPLNAWRTMPTGSILSLAVAKIVVMPVLGVAICQGLTSAGVIDRDDKVLRFVCIFFSCLPTATTQVYLTQVYSDTGSADHISAYLIPQYILMVFVMPILTAYSINLLF